MIPRTSTEWDAEADVIRRVKCYRGRHWFPSLRLFAIACCRRYSDHIPDVACHEALEIAERYVYRRATKRDLNDVHDRTIAVAQSLEQIGPKTFFDGGVESNLARATAACLAPAEHSAIWASHFVRRSARALAYYSKMKDGGPRWEADALAEEAEEVEVAEQIKMLNRLVGNPFARRLTRD